MLSTDRIFSTFLSYIRSSLRLDLPLSTEIHHLPRTATVILSIYLWKEAIMVKLWRHNDIIISASALFQNSALCPTAVPASLRIEGSVLRTVLGFQSLTLFVWKYRNSIRHHNIYFSLSSFFENFTRNSIIYLCMRVQFGMLRLTDCILSYHSNQTLYLDYKYCYENVML